MTKYSIEIIREGILLGAIVNGYRIKQLYSGYSLREAKRLFKMYLQTLETI